MTFSTPPESCAPRGYARDAGFADIEVLPIEHDMFRFYRLLC